jgi:hypothetical protein
MIAASPEPPVAYLWEPFSVLHRQGILDARFPYWFPYVCTENGGAYETPIRDMLRFRYRAGAELVTIRSPKDAGRMVRDRSRFRRWRRENARPLLKDPIAIYSAEWLADTFDMDVLVLIRHPAAFVNSIVSRRLRHPFDDFLRQPLLMRDTLDPYRDEIERFAATEQPLFDQGILLWNVLHAAILDSHRRGKDWCFQRLEDVAMAPESSFRALYDRLGLRFDESVRRTVAEHSGSDNAAEVADPASRKRDSAASIAAWKRHLSPEDVQRIRDSVEAISKEFYSDEDW